MKTSRLLLNGLLLPSTVLLPLLSVGCEGGPICGFGEVPVRLRSSPYSDDWVCMPRGQYDNARTPSPSPSATDDESPTATAAPPPTVEVDAGAAPVDSEGCGLVAASSAVMRVVEKTEAAPSFAPEASKVADGRYELVQASFFRSEQGQVGVPTLRASVDVRGGTFVLGAESVSGGVTEPNESITLLVDGTSVTKVCETRHGNVSSWFFPMKTGESGEARVEYNGLAGQLRLVVARPEGHTELVFAR